MFNKVREGTAAVTLTARDLHCERDERTLFRELSFSVSSGQVLQVQGSNGSGKTTLLRALCGLNSDYEGQLYWQNRPMKEARSDFLSQVFYLGHAQAINKTLSPVENLRWLCAAHGHSPPGGIADALAGFGLRGYENVPCFMLSAGQRRRVSLARLKLSPARLWLLDEPFTALDRRGVEDLQRLLTDFVRAGGALALASHHPVQLDCTIDTIDLDQELGRTAQVFENKQLS